MIVCDAISALNKLTDYIFYYSSPAKGPDEAKIKAILERTGYSLDVTTGQRKYGGPPPNWDTMPPGNGCEVGAILWEFNYNV